MTFLISAVCCCMPLTSTAGCTNSKDEQKNPNAEFYLVRGDTYDFKAAGFTVKGVGGTALTVKGNVIEASKCGTDTVTVQDNSENELLYKITVTPTAYDTHGKYPIDKGIINGKNVVVFGDSITDGHMGSTVYRYSETYYAQLCEYLGAANDATDLKNSNFARSGTTMTYGLRNEDGISGVERVAKNAVFTEKDGKQRDPYENIPNAELCIIFYGTNDFTENVYKDNTQKPKYDDKPNVAKNAKTIKGGLYFMINKLYELNPSLKILVLPPLYRRAEAHLVYVEDNKNEVINLVTREKLSEYGEVMQNVCGELGARFINWYSVFNYENFGATNTYTDDGLHPNAKGHKKMFDYIIEHL